MAPAIVCCADFGGAKGRLETAAGEVGLAEDVTQPAGLAIKAVLSLTGAIFFGMMIYAGILWMTAGGKEEQIGKSKKIVFASVIGLFVVISAYAATVFITERLGRKGPTDVPAGAAPPADALAACELKGGVCIPIAANQGKPCDPTGWNILPGEPEDPYTGNDLGLCESNEVCCEIKDSAGGGRDKCENYMKGSCMKVCPQGQEQIGTCALGIISHWPCCK